MNLQDIIDKSEEINKRSTKTVVLTENNYNKLTSISKHLESQNKKISIKDIVNILLSDSLDKIAKDILNK